MNKSYKFVYHSFKLIFMKGLFRAKITYLAPLDPKIGCIIASNHQSNWDPPIVSTLIEKQISYLAKEELFKFKPLAWLITKLNAIPIKRGIIDKRAIKTVNNVLERGETILIFPEGSRKSTKAKAGIGLLAMNTNCMIVPVHIENSNKALACFFGLKRLKIVVGKPIEPSYFKDWERNKENYRKLSSEVLDTINGLKDVN